MRHTGELRQSLRSSGVLLSDPLATQTLHLFRAEFFGQHLGEMLVDGLDGLVM